jgi:flavin reductase (DIM6/NTAB) family NADH-FMN oxidoreductase RutF
MTSAHAAAATGGTGIDAARAATRRLSSGVSVLTVTHGGAPHGTTVSTVTALSRDPLMVGACLRLGSTFTDLVRAAGWFTVNVLATRQAPTADWFADPARPGGAAQFALFDWQSDALTGAPRLGGSLAWLSCRLAGCQPAGDHEVLVANVVAGQSGTGAPLLTYAGALHGAGLYEVRRRRIHAARPDCVTTLE